METNNDQTRKKPAGGFVLLAAGELFTPWWLRKLGVIRALDFRAFFALLEMRERRCAAPDEGRDPEYSLKELSKLCGGAGERELKTALRRLKRAGLVKQFTRSTLVFARGPDDLTLDEETRSVLEEKLGYLRSPRRLVPFPRRMARLLASGACYTFAGVILGTAIATLFYRRGKVTSRGAYKASWLAAAFGLSERTVYRHRTYLIEELGWLRAIDSHQLDQNARGLLVEVDLDWEAAVPAEASDGAGKQGPDRAPAGPSAPADCQAPRPKNTLRLSGPRGSYKNPFQEGDLNNKPASGGGPRPGIGVSQPRIQESNPGRIPRRPTAGAKPSLKRVTLQDLKDPKRLLVLHEQAVGEGLITGSEHDRLQFFTAAERAKTVGSQNPPGLFVRIVRSALWRFLSQDDEDAARRKIRELLHPEGRPGEIAPPRPLFGLSNGIGRQVEAPRPTPSEDALIVRSVTNALQRAGYRGDPFYALKSQRPEWTRERWERAETELARN